MKKIIKQLLLYFLLFAIIKIILSYFISAPSTFNDSYHYIKLARSFFNSQGFSIHGDISYSRQPLYPIILSISYLFKNMVHIFLAMKIINAIISSLIIFPAFLLSKEFLSEKKALTSAILISLIPSNFAFAPYIMSENLLYPLFLFAVYFMYKSFADNDYKYSILAGLFVSLCILTKVFGVILIVVYILICAIYYLKKKSQTNPLFFLTIPIFTMIMGIRISSSDPNNIFTHIFTLTFYIQLLLYVCYIILATGIFFTITAIASLKNKNKKYFLFILITFFSTVLLLIVCANHGIYNSFFEWVRPLGRYIEMILPLIFIMGFVGIERKYSKIIPFFIPIIIFASLLTKFSLFPVNNMSLIWMGILNYIFPSFIFIIIFLLVMLFLIFLLGKSKKAISIFIIFFLSVSLLNYAVTYYNVEKFWYNEEQMQLGLWLNKYDKGNSLIIFDERDCTEFILKLNQTSICEPLKTATIIGTWLNNDIRINDVSNPPKNSIIISRHNLDFKKIKETESDIFVYEIK